jgi:HAD superfamily hydrolase (TIGR01490 family)
VKGPREVEEVNEVDEVKDGSGGVAAFFDLDGTLVALPSLERKFFRILRYRREIRTRNYFFWLREAIRLMPRGISTILQANKMYLRGVQILNELAEGDGVVSSWHKDGHQAEGQASAPPRRNPRLPVPTFFAQAVETAAWHAKQGHEIVLLSGTLEPLAREAAHALEARLAACGIALTIREIATRLEETGGKWTGRILGVAMFGEAKARAAKRMAEELRLDLRRCYAYGDSLNDRWLMEVVGRPAAVNPTRNLASIARTHGWPILHWEEKQNITQRRPVPVPTGSGSSIGTSAVNRESAEEKDSCSDRMQVMGQTNLE